MDREKVINELNIDVLPFLQHHCDMQCDREKRWISKMIITVHDAVALLKEKEAFEPKVIGTNGFGHPVHACGKCGLLITESMNYCHECGKRIDWEGW